jgi:hypothetical protein
VLILCMAELGLSCHGEIKVVFVLSAPLLCCSHSKC